MSCPHDHHHQEAGSLRAEFLSHLPYSIFGTVVGILLAALVTIGARLAGAGEEVLESVCGSIFHIFHPVHMLLSAAATTAMFFRHENRVLKAVVVGIIGSVGVCGISDVLMPYLSGVLLMAREHAHDHAHGMHFHWCVIEHPWLIVPFAVGGVLVGLSAARSVQKITFYSHSAHVLVSSAASIFYLIAFGLIDWIQHLGFVLVVITAAVMLPCCFSDIIFPLLCKKKPGAGPRQVM
jgi:hypothetical protein